MEKYNIFINDNKYEFTTKLTIKEACQLVGISIPSIYLSDDIDYVEIDSSLIDSSVCIEDGMCIYTESNNVLSFIENKIKELHAKLSTSCVGCSVINCPLKEQFNKYHLSDNGSNYKECSYYQNGVRNKVLIEEEKHQGLEELLKNTKLHKVAIIDQNMKPKKAEILNKGFNEVITSDFVKKFKIIEESALFVEEIAKALDKRENLLPVYILEEESLQQYISKTNYKSIVNVGNLVDLTTKIFKASLDYELVSFVYITENNFNNETNKEVTYDYLMGLPDVVSDKVSNITKLLKLDNKEINYNSFINYLVDIFKSKQKFTEDIYNMSDYVIKLKGRNIKISNMRYSDCINSDIILVLNEGEHNNTSSVLYDEDVNYIYKNYIKKPGDL